MRCPESPCRILPQGQPTCVRCSASKSSRRLDLPSWSIPNPPQEHLRKRQTTGLQSQRPAGHSAVSSLNKPAVRSTIGVPTQGPSKTRPQPWCSPELRYASSWAFGSAPSKYTSPACSLQIHAGGRLRWQCVSVAGTPLPRCRSPHQRVKLVHLVGDIPCSDNTRQVASHCCLRLRIAASASSARLSVRACSTTRCPCSVSSSAAIRPTPITPTRYQPSQLPSECTRGPHRTQRQFEDARASAASPPQAKRSR